MVGFLRSSPYAPQPKVQARFREFLLDRRNLQFGRPVPTCSGCWRSTTTASLWPARSTSSASWQGGAGWPRPPCPRRSSGGHPQLHRDHAALLAVHGPLQEGLRVGTRKGAKPSEDPHRGALAARVRGGLRQVPRVRPHPMIKVEQMMAGAHALQPFTFPAQHVDSYKLDTQRDRQGPRRGLPCEPDRARPQRALQHLLPICRLCFSPSLQNSCFYTNSSQSNAEV